MTKGQRHINFYAGDELRKRVSSAVELFKEHSGLDANLSQVVRALIIQGLESHPVTAGKC